MSIILRKKWILISLLFIFVSGGQLFSETTFLLEAYAEGEDKIKMRIDALGTEGFIPVGIEIESDSGLIVLYAKDPGFSYDNWVLFSHNLDEDFESEVTQFLKEGWVPMDVAKTGNAITILYIRGGFTKNISIKGWRLAKSEMKTETLKKTLSDFQKKGFSPWGFSLDYEDVWYLFLNDGGAQKKQFFIEGYKLDSDYVRKSITDDINKGWMPWGLMVENLGAFILYTKTVE